MNTSPTQYDTFISCKRKWWFTYVKKLPQESKPYLLFGEILHSLLENYQKQDRISGVDALFEGDWYKKTVDRWGNVLEKPEELNLQEQSLCKKLLHLGISSGAITRRVNVILEEPVELQVIPEVKCRGFIDIRYNNIIEDYKTTKNLRYAYSSAGLSREIKMLIYAYYVHTKSNKDRYILKHTYFCKDPENPQVKIVEAQVDSDRLLSNWEYIKGLSQDMLTIAEEDAYKNIDMPVDFNSACNKYGGCPYMGICHRNLPVQRYIDNVTGKGIEKMNARLMKLLNKEQKNQEKIEVGTPSGTPPWTNPDCRACEGKGFSSKGTPCRICDVWCKQNSKQTSADFDISTDSEGNIQWKEKTKNVNIEDFKVKKTIVIGRPKAEDKQPELDFKSAPEPETKAKEEVKFKEEVKTKAKTKVKKKTKTEDTQTEKGFILLVNCHPVNSDGAIYLRDYLSTVGNILAKELNVDNYFKINAFDRRDMLSQKGEELARGLSGYVIVDGMGFGTSDLRAIFDAVRPFADMEIHGHV